MNGVNLRRFEFDYDTTWVAFFLDPELNIYSRFGGRDEGEPEQRLSKPSLLLTMDEVLAAHRDLHGSAGTEYRPVRTADLKGRAIPITGEPQHPEDIPLLKQSHQGCVHCHQVAEYRVLQWAHDGQFDRRRLFGWPLPEGLGIEVDRDHGHRVRGVRGDSPAKHAGIQPGDVIRAAAGQPVRSELDLRWVLHRLEEPDGPVRIQIERPGTDSSQQSLTVELKPQPGWRQSELGWRKSLRSVPFHAGFRGYALTRTPRRELSISEDGLAIKLVSVRDHGLAGALKLQKGDVVVAHLGVSRHREFSEFLSDLLRKHQPGDTVRLTVLRDGQRIELEGRFPDWHTDETSVP